MHPPAPLVAISEWTPAEATLLRNGHRVWIPRIALGCLTLLLIGVAIGGPLGYVVGTLAATFAVILIPAFWYNARSTQTQIDALRDRGAYARWTIDRAAWARWRDDRRAKFAAAGNMSSLLILVGGLVAAGLAHDDGHTTAALSLAIGAVALAALAQLGLRGLTGRAPDPTLVTIPLVIGPNGALTLDGYLPWRAFGVIFVGATVTEDPPTLAVAYTLRSKYGNREHTYPLPVPSDHLTDAHRVAAALNATPR